ncbi:hypothetical protein ACQREB_05320 [Candidatus Spyradosoma sp. SGI.093]
MNAFFALCEKSVFFAVVFWRFLSFLSQFPPFQKFHEKARNPFVYAELQAFLKWW